MEPAIYTYPDFLTAEECSYFLALIRDHPSSEGRPFTRLTACPRTFGACSASLTPPFTTPFTNTGNFDNKKWHDPLLASQFHQRLKEVLGITDVLSPSLLRANSLVMTGRYKPGDSFNLHTDTGLYYNRETRTKSRWTLLIYLNDDFEGGTTEFFDDAWKPTRTVLPKAGTALLFDIDLWHRGVEVTKGEKCWIGCEIIGAF